LARFPLRLLQITAPAGIEQGFIEMGAPATALTLPPSHIATPEEMEKMATIGAKYHVETLGHRRTNNRGVVMLLCRLD